VPRKVILSPEARLSKFTFWFRAQISRPGPKMMHRDMSLHVAVLCESLIAELAWDRLLMLFLVPPGIKS
jgi:hypothetical protein